MARATAAGPHHSHHPHPVRILSAEFDHDPSGRQIVWTFIGAVLFLVLVGFAVGIYVMASRDGTGAGERSFSEVIDELAAPGASAPPGSALPRPQATATGPQVVTVPAAGGTPIPMPPPLSSEQDTTQVSNLLGYAALQAVNQGRKTASLQDLAALNGVYTLPGITVIDTDGRAVGPVVNVTFVGGQPSYVRFRIDPPLPGQGANQQIQFPYSDFTPASGGENIELRLSREATRALASASLGPE
jgi:hypothetical protein